MREHRHCKCGKVIRNEKDYSIEGLRDKCSSCRREFVMEAVFMALHPHLPSTQKYFNREEK